VYGIGPPLEATFARDKHGVQVFTIVMTLDDTTIVPSTTVSLRSTIQDSLLVSVNKDILEST
jgi:hypothetical protein